MSRATTRRLHPLGGVVALAALALTGCTGASGGAAPTPEASPTPLHAEAQAVSGTAATGSLSWTNFPIPTGARSVVIDFECDGSGPFTVELGDTMMLGTAPISGTCGIADVLSWPISLNTGHTLGVSVSEGAKWVATPHFSKEEFVSDAKLASDCASFSSAYSALVNADQGLESYQAFGEDEWRVRVSGAAIELRALAQTSSPPLARASVELAASVGDPALKPGSATAAAESPVAAVRAFCDRNQSPIGILAEFGG